MALYRSPKIKLARYFFCIIVIVLGIGENRYARTASEAYMYGVNKVNICPQNKTQWEEASRRLNCSNDTKPPLNRYHCLPVHDLSTLMEFCYNRTRPQVVKGLCMVYVKESNSLNSYSCTAFEDGCPDMFYLSDESYKYPKCLDIDPIGRCYLAESSCKLATTTSSNITSITGGTGHSSSPKYNDDVVVIAISTSVEFLVLTCIVVAIIYKRRDNFCKRKDIDFDPRDADPLLPKSEIAEMEREGLNYLLQEFPSDIKPKLIAKILNVPPDILSWSMERRQQFVESMNEGSVNEYSGRGIVIGTADTGNMNLVEKLKRKNNLRTESTRGIKIYSHEFMLDAKECTIIVANNKERGEKPDGNEPSLTAFDPIELKEIETGEHLIAKQTNLDTKPLISNLRDPSDVVLKAGLKRLNLLDFDGQNACHRIFFSSRAFYIVLIDISKDLYSPMDEGFYSDWTYADYIRYWLGFIHTYGSMSAPVILVTSHLRGTEADKDKTVLSEYFEKICHTLPETLVKHLDKKRVFFVDKTSDKNMKDLKKCIASTWKLQDHWGKSIPKTWTKIESVLRMKRRSFKMCSISSILEDLKRIDDKLINNIGELVAVLMYFHDTGLILFQNDVEEIILDVQWFADAFKSIAVNDKHSLAQFKELNDSGLLSSQLLNDLWSNSDLTFHENRDNLVKHMVKLDMMAELNSTQWYVPCMNKQEYTKSNLENCTVSSTLCFGFEFLPLDIFHRLVATCINKHNMTLWQSEGKYCIYNNVTFLKCENTTLIVLIGIRCGKENADEKYPHSIEIQAININNRVGTVDSFLCSDIKQIICEALSNLTQTFQTDAEPFHLGYRCVITPYDDLPEGHIIFEKDISTDCGVKCSKCEQNHEIDVDSLISHWKSTVSGACGGIETDSGFYQRAPETKAEDSLMVRSNAYGMEQIHKDALRRTRMALVTNLDVDIIFDELLGRDIFTPLMMEYIKNERTRIDKVRRLLDDLVRRGSNAYNDFLDILKETGYKYLANEIVRNERLLSRENATTQARAEIHTSTTFDKSKHNATTRAESSNVQLHQGGLVVLEVVLSDTNFLPRYKYHRFLLKWFVEGLPQPLASELKSNFQDCSIIIGGRLSDNDKEKLFGDATTKPFINQPKGPDTRMCLGFQEVLIVYFFTEDTSDLFQLIAMTQQYFWSGSKISLLLVKGIEDMNVEKMKDACQRDLLLHRINDVDFASKSKEEIITKITCSLEKRLITFFEQAHKTLQKYSSPTKNVQINLLEVKAILRRLGKAVNVSISEPFKNDVVEEDTERKEIEKIFQRFADQILYRRYDGNTLYIIVCSEPVKNSIIYYFSELRIENISYVITVDCRLSITELSKPGVPLHGAKFVYESEDVDDFYVDNAFATAGCLMMANNNNTIVAVTCRHAVEDVETCYTLIEDSVVKLGQKQQSGNQMKFLYDDIAVIVVDNETHFVVNQKCEKLLLDTSDIPSPAQICLTSLETGDIVHKRGAKTGLTTGVVNDVKYERIGNFIFPSRVIYVIGRDGEPFADRGDSGSLVFRHSMSPVSNVLDVCAMVNGKIDIPIQNPDVLCFPFNEGCESLRENVPDIQSLNFFHV